MEEGEGRMGKGESGEKGRMQKCGAEINSVKNAQLIKKETSAQTKFIWVIKSDKKSGRV